ncbi:hypothetical protein [Leptolyngbya sp. AN02str]
MSIGESFTRRKEMQLADLSVARWFLMVGVQGYQFPDGESTDILAVRSLK